MQASLFEEPGDITKSIRKRHWHWRDAEPSKRPMAEPGDLFCETQAHPVERFGSGCSALFDMLGYMLVGLPVGVTAKEIPLSDTQGRLELLARYANAGGRVFVDSGAFGAFTNATPLDFEAKVFPVYDALASKVGRHNGLMFVMPDCIGDADATRALQEQHRDHIQAWLDAGVECLFPLQGPQCDPLREFDRVACLAAGRTFTVGIPSNKKAWSAPQTLEFIRAAQPQRVHLLGLARERVLKQIAREAARLSPQTRLSCDSCEIIAHAGVGRRITDRCASRTEAAIEWLAGGGWLEVDALDIPDLTTFLVDLWWEPGFVTPSQALALAQHLGCEGSTWSERFVRGARSGMAEVFAALDPDEQWLHPAVADFAKTHLYAPWVTGLIAGPIRAWEVARMCCGDDPDWFCYAKRHNPGPSCPRRDLTRCKGS